MNRGHIFPGLRALSVGAIGKLPADSVVKVLVADTKKVTIEAIVDAVKREYFLSVEEFRRDFHAMEFFAGAEIAAASSLAGEANEKAPPPDWRSHSRDYLYTSVV